MSGENANSHEDKATEYQGGEVHILATELGYDAGGTELANNSEASATTTGGDWAISVDTAAATTTLENTAEIELGEPSGFVIDQVVLESPDDPDNFAFDNDPAGDTDLGGDGSLSFEPGALTFVFGGD